MNARQHAVRDHAIVIGGSIAGIWAARILADHFERVTVIDRDHFPETPEARRGVPQGRQVHILLIRGQQILDQLFPGLCAELDSEDVTTIRWTEDAHSYGLTGRWNTPFSFGYTSMGCSRILLEWHMRQRLQKNPKITFVEGRVVSALLTDDSKATVTGVRMEAVGAERASVSEETLTADLVVDCSGRESRAPEWLTALGYDAPEEVVIDSHVGYATRLYQPSETLDVSWKSLLIQSRSGNVSRSALIYSIEHHQWMALMVGVNVPLPDTDESYLEFARALPVPDAYNAIKDAQPLTPIYRYQRTANQIRHYGALARMPESFILIGDAVCAFNPVFGQGMSVSAMEALLLDKELRRQPQLGAGFAHRFQKKVARLIAAPWQLATSEDARNLKEGESVNVSTRLLSLYMGHLLSMVGTDEQVGRAFLEVMHLLKHPVTLFYPRIAVKILRSMLTTRQPLAPRAAPQPAAESR